VQKPRTVAFIGLNPSTADETQDDPTIRRCRAFACSWGYDNLVMLNLFAYRATRPADMKAAADPIGPDNDWHLLDACMRADLIVAAWGSHGSFWNRDVSLRKLLGRCQLHYLRLTKDGHPAHPLYLPGWLKPTFWSAQ
jgi:hypothetical protein